MYIVRVYCFAFGDLCFNCACGGCMRRIDGWRR